ncbi:MAG TPA: enolase C-terminal domain-like protein [Candidatus Dormibacteraeota bacterium]|nr:enolase C-terminal domain-like protein [Candidatus Dormibacteraeota bacterium]
MTRSARITAVEVDELRGAAPPSSGRMQQQVRPLDAYRRPGEASIAPPAAGELRHLYLTIRTDAGVQGLYGPIDSSAAWVIVDQLADFLIGRDGLAGSVIWDQLYRLDRHSRHGHFKMAISAVDNALWDLRGRVFEAPVHQLLGGPSRSQLRAYASTLGTRHDDEEIAALIERLAREGYRHQKWFFAFGPADGAEGMKRNLAMTETVRTSAGDDIALMFDAFMGWDLAYARAWARQAERFAPTWLEEPFSPTQFDAFRMLRQSTEVPISAGEHLYDRADVLPYLREGILSVLQADPEWCGGVTELTRICALAETFGIPVIPHGHGLHAAIHVIASQSPATCPLVEYLIHGMPRRHHFEVDPPRPVDGSFPVPSLPGFGIRLDEGKIESRRRWPYGASEGGAEGPR